MSNTAYQSKWVDKPTEEIQARIQELNTPMRNGKLPHKRKNKPKKLGEILNKRNKILRLLTE